MPLFALIKSEVIVAPKYARLKFILIRLTYPMISFLIRTAVSIILAVFSVQFAYAQNYCDPKTIQDVQDLSASVGSKVDVLSPRSRYLMSEIPTTVRIVAPVESDLPADIRYRIFYVTGSDPEEPLREIRPVEVTRDNQGTTIRFKPGSDSGSLSLFIIGCSPSADKASESLPPHFAVIEANFTGRKLASVIAVSAAFIALAIIGLFGHSYKPTSEMSFGKGILYCFTNFRRELSLSRVQLFVFSLIVFLTVVYYFARSGELTDLSADVLYLLGISGAGAVGGAWGDAMKNRLTWENWHWLDRQHAFLEPGNDLPLRLGQLVSTRGEFDLYRFQALLFTFLVAPAFVVTSFLALDSVEIPDGILAVLGLSQVTYLVGKFADTPTVSDFDKSISEIRTDLESGAKLTARGFADLKSQFKVAMGMKWAGETDEEESSVFPSDLITSEEEAAIKDALSAVQPLAVTARVAATEARSIADAGADPEIIVEADIAGKAAEEAEAALKTAKEVFRGLKEANVVDPKAAISAREIAERAAGTAQERLDKIKAPG